MKYYIAVDGLTPSDIGTTVQQGILLGEIKLFSYPNYVPSGLLPCDGQLVNISTYPLLFAFIGTTFGGNGQTNFALPDMRKAIPHHN